MPEESIVLAPPAVFPVIVLLWMMSGPVEQIAPADLERAVVPDDAVGDRQGAFVGDPPAVAGGAPSP